MSIINNNKNKMPKVDGGLDGMAAFRALLKDKGVHAHNENPNKNKLFVTYTRCNVHENEIADDGVIFYHADIVLFDEYGHPNTATTLFHVSLLAEEQKGEEAVKAELNEIVNQKMRALVALHKNS